ncbi:TIM barrel protein [Pseudarthrobacter sp. J64]|uniref:sugar phosphate isomerase/epimerase family protein n=1 Tax=Pseudarthrobacter sp. J64 TaxID=3116485 RepID=UPI002E822F3A|nr:TIM barrel protein [Pseudarthrobacter sp. J64]MEE2568570.1 TIM barrel protein [Pseudarthrobacter sp. J64]
MDASLGLSEWNRAHLVPGLCSVTLRDSTIAEVAEITADAGLAGIEWGTDAHVVDEAAAGEAAQATAEAGLEVLSLGSYYRLGSGADFQAVAGLAVRAGAPRIRVWAGSVASAGSDDPHWANVVADAKRVAGIAGEHNLTLALEYHSGTLTDTPEGTVRLLEAINERNVGTYWQPAVGLSDEDAVASLRLVLPFLAGIHCFSWWPQDQRQPLEARAGLWESVASILHGDSLQMDLMLEFVQDDQPANLLRDADFLNEVVLRED